jgi:ribonuclease BN (tRNA processing enzyme)
VELIVLGSAPAYTDRPGSAASSYLLRTGSAALLLDLGQGSLANLAATVEPSTLTAILVSHLHPDHFVDLVPLRHYLKWEFVPSRRLDVVGPAGLAGRVDSLNGEPGFAAEALDVETLAEGILRVGPFEVEVRRIAHTEESYAFRVAPARRNGDASAPGLVYSGDCSRADDLLPLIRPGDTLLSEATFGAGPVAPGAQHITSGDAARVAASAGAARMLLTHILSGHSRQATLDAACAAFTGPVRLVTEGDRFEI